MKAAAHLVAYSQGRALTSDFLWGPSGASLRDETLEAIRQGEGWLEDWGECLVTERGAAIDAFEKIMDLVEHDSDVYVVAAKEHAGLVAAQRDEELNPAAAERQRWVKIFRDWAKANRDWARVHCSFEGYKKTSETEVVRAAALDDAADVLEDDNSAPWRAGPPA